MSDQQPAPWRRRDLRSFGRLRARKLTARQQQLYAKMLPAYRIDPTSAAADPFDIAPREIWLEIGFGGGEHLIWQAERHPDVGLIGCEPFLDGIVKVLDAVERRGLKNVRLYDGDARDILRGLPPGTLSRAFVLFPDPWPKRRHIKRRLINAVTLQLLAAALAPGSQLRIATDVADYARAMLLAVRQCPGLTWPATATADWRQRPPDWPPTRYEAKADREGRRCYYFRFLRV